MTSSSSNTKKVNHTALNRLRQDYLRLKRDPVPYILAEPLPSNILEWSVNIRNQFQKQNISLLRFGPFTIGIVSRKVNISYFCSRHYIVRGPEASPYEGLCTIMHSRKYFTFNSFNSS